MSSLQAASGPAKLFRTLLIVICGKGGLLNGQATHREIQGHARPAFQVNENFGTGPQLEVQILEHPAQQELRQTLGCLLPEIVFFHADLSTGNGALVLGDVKFSQPETLVNLFSPLKFPDLVYLEANAGRLGPALCKAGVPHVVYWDYAVPQLVAYHFCQSLVAALRSARAGIEEAFDMASSSMLMHCTHNRVGRSSDGEPKVLDLRPLHFKLSLEGKPQQVSQRPKVEGESEHDEFAGLPTILQIYDLCTEVRLLICTEPSRMDAPRLRALEIGLSALLVMEASGIRIVHRVSAPPPPMAAAAHARGIVTMRCDLCTSSFARIPLVVSGSAHTCFDDQLLERTIKEEMVKKDGLVRLSPSTEDLKGPFPQVTLVGKRRSSCIASGASVAEICVITRYWAAQMLRQLSSQPSYRSLAAFGIAGVDGTPVAAFCKHDADHLNCLLEDQAGELRTVVQGGCGSFSALPKWLSPPKPSRKRSRLHLPEKGEEPDITRRFRREKCMSNGVLVAHSQHGKVGEGSARKRPSVLAALKPVPRAKQRDAMPYSAAVVIAGAHAGWSMKLPLPNGMCGRAGRTGGGGSGHSDLPLAAADGISSHLSFPLDFPLVKAHGCKRKPMLECSEDEFLKDVIEFLISKGHGRLVPPAGLDAFPEVVLNAKRLDLYNLYKEVVSRGGFHVGNGINWKGQVFSKMQNHTSSNKMTGVGNALKKHYETYLLEYEFAHDDVDGECCIICHNGAEGDWVNCGVCGEWAHFGCDRRVVLATFKEYAKADGVEYICPRCSAENDRGSRGSRKGMPAQGRS